MESEIRRELDHLQTRLATESEQLINPGQAGMAGGPGGGGFEPADVSRLNNAIRKARGIDRIEARINELQAQLDALQR